MIGARRKPPPRLDVQVLTPPPDDRAGAPAGHELPPTHAREGLLPSHSQQELSLPYAQQQALENGVDSLADMQLVDLDVSDAHDINYGSVDERLIRAVDRSTESIRSKRGGRRSESGHGSPTAPHSPISSKQRKLLQSPPEIVYDAQGGVHVVEAPDEYSAAKSGATALKEVAAASGDINTLRTQVGELLRKVEEDMGDADGRADHFRKAQHDLRGSATMAMQPLLTLSRKNSRSRTLYSPTLSQSDNTEHCANWVQAGELRRASAHCRQRLHGCGATCGGKQELACLHALPRQRPLAPTPPSHVCARKHARMPAGSDSSCAERGQRTAKASCTSTGASRRYQ